MKPTLKLFAFCLVAVGLLSSCVSSKKYNELLAAKTATDQALAETQGIVKTLQDENAQLKADKDKLMGDMDQVKKDLKMTMDEVAKVKEMVNQKDAEIKRVKGEIDNAFADFDTPGLTVRQDGDMFYVSMEEKILFRSGSTNLSATGKKILDSFADLLKKNAGLQVMAEGHTDSKPIATDRFPSNWELSVGRATAVVRYLVKQGVEPGRLVAAGRADFDPVNAEAKTADERQQNRRVEFAVVPDVGKLYEMIKG
ncbi:MAG TPA: OmpA family protein [Saprospiraceae bacterium]|nr:OmpA family protein [Saprospiraceae bacterium]